MAGLSRVPLGTNEFARQQPLLPRIRPRQEVDMDTLTVAVASCCSVLKRPKDDQPAWTAIREANPGLLLLLGDTVYMHVGAQDEWIWKHADLEEAYRRQFEVTDFDALLNREHLAIWDDHDFGINDARGAEAGAENVRLTTERFRRHMHRALNVQGVPVVPGTIYGSVTRKGVHFIALDGRTLRTHPGAEFATVLGPDQLERFLLELQDHRDQVVVVMSGSCLLHGYVHERLFAYDEFSDTVMTAMRAHGRVLFLSGDIHRNAFVNHAGLFEVTTSGVAQISSKTADKLDNWAMLEFGPEWIEVRWHGEDAESWTREGAKYRRFSDIRSIKIDINSWTLLS
jgi:hypothetical protein